MKTTTLAATAALFASLALGVQAEERKDAPMPESVTKADFVLRAVERFDAMDANKDGVLTREEARSAYRARMRQDVKENRYERRKENKVENKAEHKAERAARRN